MLTARPWETALPRGVTLAEIAISPACTVLLVTLASTVGLTVAVVTDPAAAIPTSPKLTDATSTSAVAAAVHVAVTVKLPDSVSVLAST